MNNANISREQTLKLWNPSAAVNWSVLFGPIFGAWLHTKNWEELGKHDKAEKSKIWFYVWVFFYLAPMFVWAFFYLAPMFGPYFGSDYTKFAVLLGGVGITLFFTWYFSSARGQVKYLKENNINYEKKAWGKPLLIGLAGLIIQQSVVQIGPLPSLLLNDALELKSVSLVNQILKNKHGDKAATCKAVSIEKKISDGFYHAVAYLDNGNELKIAIELKGDTMFVKIPILSSQ